MIKNLILLTLLCVFSVSLAAKPLADKQEVYKLSYIEREPGTDEYGVTMLVSEQFIRLDEEGEESGFIIYDDKDRIIYSISHHDKSVLIIKKHAFSENDAPVKSNVEFLQLADAPMVSGKNIFNYRVFSHVGKSQKEETCLEIQLVENLMPKVRKMLQNYQEVISGQQVKMVDNQVTDRQTACFYVDQVYNAGKYYEKGLPVQEWHSNERSKILTGYEKTMVDPAIFNIPKDYRQFSIGGDSKTFIN